jgi:proteasome-associated ATPase
MSSQDLIAARDLIREQGEILERYAEGGLTLASVLSVTNERVLISTSSGIMETARPKEIWGKKLKPGSAVLIIEGAIVKTCDMLAYGSISTVSRLVDATTVEVTSEGQPRLVYSGVACQVGDTVCLDATNRVVVRVLPQDSKRFEVAIPFVSWDHIGGQEQAKMEMREAVELPLLHPKLFEAYGKKPSHGIMLYGPPGCGKTKIGKATASSLAQRGDGGGFMYVKGAEVLDPYVGVAEATVRAIFDRARKYKNETGQQAVVFVDEADAILGRRGGRQSHMEKTIVPTFLTEMDGLEESGAMVILSTNRPDTLDSAITRDGRISRQVKVSRPTKKDAAEIFNIYLKDKPLTDKSAEVAEAASHALYDPALRIFSLKLSDNTDHDFTLANLASGAMVEGIVDRAVSRAMRRDIENKERKATGLKAEDVLEAVVSTYRQNISGDHIEALVDFADGREIMRKDRYHVSEAA